MEKTCLQNAWEKGQGNHLSKIELVKAVSIEVQRWNSNMILDRSPRETPLKTSDLSEVSIAVSKWKEEASEKLKSIALEPATICNHVQQSSLNKSLNPTVFPSTRTSTNYNPLAGTNESSKKMHRNDNATSNFKTSVITVQFQNTLNQKTELYYRKHTDVGLAENMDRQHAMLIAELPKSAAVENSVDGDEKRSLFT